MDELMLLVDLHKGAARQGPGGDVETVKAVDLAGIDRDMAVKIADIGCGTGASTLTLARLLNAEITAVDFLAEFVEVLAARAQEVGVAGKISPLCASMEQLPFAAEEFDVIWSEGAIYNIGFKRGVTEWRQFLKPGGLLVVSEITWLTNSRPAELQEHWHHAYPEIDTASAKIQVLEDSGYQPVGYFVLPEHCWLDNYYAPMIKRFDDFLARNGQSEAARDIVAAERHEIELYRKYKAYFSYGVYIARKRSD